MKSCIYLNTILEFTSAGRLPFLSAPSSRPESRLCCSRHDEAHHQTDDNPFVGLLAAFFLHNRLKHKNKMLHQFWGSYKPLLFFYRVALYHSLYSKEVALQMHEVVTNVFDEEKLVEIMSDKVSWPKPRQRFSLLPYLYWWLVAMVSFQIKERRIVTWSYKASTKQIVAPWQKKWICR